MKKLGCMAVPHARLLRLSAHQDKHGHMCRHLSVNCEYLHDWAEPSWAQSARLECGLGLPDHPHIWIFNCWLSKTLDIQDFKIEIFFTLTNSKIVVLNMEPFIRFLKHVLHQFLQQYIYILSEPNGQPTHQERKPTHFTWQPSSPARSGPASTSRTHAVAKRPVWGTAVAW